MLVVEQGFTTHWQQQLRPVSSLRTGWHKPSKHFRCIHACEFGENKALDISRWNLALFCCSNCDIITSASFSKDKFWNYVWSVSMVLHFIDTFVHGRRKGNHRNEFPLAVRKKKWKQSPLVIALRSWDVRIISKISFEHTHLEWPPSGKMTFRVLKSTKIARSLGLRPRTPLGKLTALLQPPSWWEGAYPLHKNPASQLRLFRPRPGVPQTLNQIYAMGSWINECWAMIYSRWVIRGQLPPKMYI